MFSSVYRSTSNPSINRTRRDKAASLRLSQALYAMKTLFLLLILITANAIAEVDLVKVDKSDRKMYLMVSGNVLKEYDIALGANPKGHKVQEGDEKTPEGTYTLDYLKLDSAFYKAMHVSYPNPNDIAKAKSLGVSPGGFIMVHGQRNRLGWLSFVTQWFNWTNGCIALTNDEMDEFIKLVKVGTEIQIQW
jgi:murein L,D-transpeptidase YafK